MRGYIYKYTFPDGKVYIGQTRRPITCEVKKWNRWKNAGRTGSQRRIAQS